MLEVLRIVLVILQRVGLSIVILCHSFYIKDKYLIRRLWDASWPLLEHGLIICCNIGLSKNVPVRSSLVLYGNISYIINIYGTGRFYALIRLHISSNYDTKTVTVSVHIYTSFVCYRVKHS